MQFECLIVIRYACYSAYIDMIIYSSYDDSPNGTKDNNMASRDSPRTALNVHFRLV